MFLQGIGSIGRDVVSHGSFLRTFYLQIVCDGSRTDLSELLSLATGTKDFKCQLEYLLFRAGFFFLQPTNINRQHICSNHLKHLMPMSEKSMRCKLCVPIRNQPSAGQSGMRRVSKALALGIWEEGHPNHSWVVFENLVCINCRRFFEKKYLNDAMRQKSDALFSK
jgi:hypothetical protein